VEEASYAIDIINIPWVDNTFASLDFMTGSRPIKHFDIPSIVSHIPFLLGAPAARRIIVSFAFIGTIIVAVVVRSSATRSSFGFAMSSSSFAPLNQVVVVAD
tara:strand:- start:803 stop:1108 length:306 start_codon:yes stop_codon:yes gene_type:complete